ncbi:acylphosphatase [Litorihabitans aurantiacus]|uniref:Acylphosphatase n=1 Tax=Litorihabitans aurantiacus TaxID=1930061 RepID=A0AA37XH18_9MICO|nr:acylphosphatase [Litorihabitans aurantiacus]GMA32943.1 acylphosphatase [Litorihabitans aurantiacus]
MRVNVVVSGRVQGVGFRWSTVSEAERLGLAGWVRNLADGTVEAEVEGPEDAVAAMVAWLHHGPDAAEVAGAQVHDVPPTGRDGFEQL